MTDILSHESGLFLDTMPLVISFIGVDPPIGDDLPTIGYVDLIYGRKAPSLSKGTASARLALLEAVIGFLYFL